MSRRRTGGLLDASNRMFAMARQGKRSPHGVLSSVMLCVFIVVSFVAGTILEVALFGDAEQASSLAQEVYEWTVPFLLMIALLWVWTAWYEKRPIRTIGLTRGSWLRRYLLGAGVGLVMISLAVGLMAATGNVQFEVSDALPSGVPAIGAVVLLLLVFMVQASAEEIVVRGWYLPILGARHGPWFGLIGSSVVFAAFHGLTDALATVNFVLFAVFLALYCLYEGSIWGACGWHATWNWGQANVFGLDVTGYPPEGGVLLDLQATGPQLLSGGSYGPEGSLMGTASLLAGIVVLLLLANRRTRRPAVASSTGDTYE